MSLIYKTLFEVKLMHQFYLTNTNGETVFRLGAQTERLKFLSDDLRDNLGSIDDDISFEFPESLKSVYNNYHIKILNNYSGFRIVAEVIKTILPGNIEVFQPKIPFPPELNFVVRLINKNGKANDITNFRFQNSLPALKFYFSNKNFAGTKEFPFLSNPASAYDFTYPYEQGEIALHGTTLKQFINDGTGDEWRNLSAKNFAAENDRLLLMLESNYVFPNEPGLTQATFELRDAAANIIKSITSSIDKSQKIKISFLDKKEQLKMASHLNDSELYALNVSGNNGFTQTHNVVFTDLISGSDLGLVHLKQSAGDTDFDLFESDGYLKRRNNPRIEAPIFEINFTSRVAFYKYINTRGLEMQVPSASLSPYLIKEGRNLITKKPLSKTRNYFLIEDETGTVFTYLPNPLEHEIKIDNNRIVNEVTVLKSDLFPTV